MKKLKLFLSVVFAVLGVAAVFTGCKGKSKEPVTHIGYFTGDLCNAPMHVAIQKGFFQEEFDAIGQKFDLISRVQATTSAGDLVASGKMDAGTDLAAAVFPQIENGLAITFTAGYHTGCTKYYAKPGSGITSVSDLKGKKVAIPGLSDSAYMNLKRKLSDVGVVTDGPDAEVEFIVYNSPDMPIALDNGAVDAIGLHDPVAAIAEETYGFTKIFDIGEDPKFAKEYCCQAFVAQRLAKENPAAAAAYTKAIMRAAAFVKADPLAAAKLQIENDYVTGDAEQNARILAALDFTPSVVRGKETVRSQAEDLIKLGFLKKDTDLNDFTDTAFTILEGIPESYEYDIATDTYYEVYEGNVKKLVTYEAKNHGDVPDCCK